MKNAKNLLMTAVIILATNPMMSQSNEVTLSEASFESFIEMYVPVQQPTVSDESFDKGKDILTNVKLAVIHDTLGWNSVDYWNVTTAFLYLDVPVSWVEFSFDKAIADGGETICAILKMMGPGKLARIIPESYQKFQSSCDSMKEKEEIFDPIAYASEYNIDISLVKLMNQISKRDQKYRDQEHMEEQRILDQKNMAFIDSLYSVYQTYLGPKIVGDKFKISMWAVIQHSEINYMEKYLPVVEQAVTDDKIHVTPYKMLLDRIHSIKHGYQLFGSQSGTPLAKPKMRAKLKRKYNLAK